MVVGGRELIDTLWNVNTTPTLATSENYLGINRYIMECKLTRIIRGCANWGINRYIMECK